MLLSFQSKAQEVSQLNKKMERMLKKHEIPGISIAIIKDQEIVYSKAYGHRSEAQKKYINEETLFQAGTIGQSLVAMAILQEVEKGNYELYGEVNTYLKSWKIRESQLTQNNPVTIFQLLSHNAGINIPIFEAYHESENMAPLLDILNGKGNALNKKIHPVIPPQSKFSYSSGAFAIVEQMIIDQQQKSFSDYMKQHILEPLHMDRSSFEQPIRKDSFFSNAAFGHNSKGVLFGKQPLYTTKAASGLWSTPTDLAKLLIHLQESLQGKKNSLFSSVKATEMLESISPTTQENISFSLGFYNYSRAEQEYFGYHGNSDGFSAMMIADKNGTCGAVVMLNKQNSLSLEENDIRQDIINLIAEFYEWEY
jgi:CubicO group peptidase (beta-lactamase class C family)